MDSPSFQPSFGERVFISLFKFINKYTPWHKLPPIVGALNLAVLRVELQAKNLYDTYVTGAVYGNAAEEPITEQFQNARNSDGKFNSTELPRMGCAGMRFGRNFPREHCQKPSEQELWTPHPRVVSNHFMTRKSKGFIPATSLNLLAAAWIQFQVHDWVFHESSDENFDIKLPPGDHWKHGPMTLPRTKPDEALDPSDIKCPAYKNANTPWWDGSQIYGSSEEATQKLRTKKSDGKLLLTENGREAFIPRDKQGNPLTGFKENWWIGMELLHTLFAMEHNAICDKLRQAYPTWTGDQIFDKARLVNCALMAKIHTVEWTPAILAHPTLQIAMNANWWGLAGEKLTKMVGRLSKSVIVSGIPGSGANQDGVPYSLTEEFTSVYRLHSLLPDKIAFFDAVDGKHQTTIPTEDTLFTHAQDPLDKGVSFADAFYSFGINYPGAITNNNYPEFLQNLKAQDGHIRDLGTVDILRDRERGVPRYNQFRRLLHMPAPKTFEELTGGNVELAQELKEVYDNDIEKVDTLVGCHSEPLPKGFGFSDTAFRIFILMASRRLQSDRFIATQWNEETYTKEGFHWVQYTTMKDVLSRHFPELAPVIAKSKNVFAPWEKLSASEKYTGIETNAPKA